MKKLTIILIALLLILVVACEKTNIETDKVQLGFAVTPYSTDYEPSLKAAAALPGWPDIPHLDYNLFEGRITIQDQNGISQSVSILPGNLTTTTISLVPNDYWPVATGLSFTQPVIYYTMYKELNSYAVGQFFNTPPVEPVYTTIDVLNTTISLDVLPGQDCYAFKDPLNVIDFVSEAGGIDGIHRNEMNFVLPTVEVSDTVFYYYNGNNDVMWVHLTHGGYVTVDLGAYKQSLIPYPEVYTRRANGTGTNPIDLPFTCYVDLSNQTTTPQQVETSFSVMNIIPFTEVIVDPY